VIIEKIIMFFSLICYRVTKPGDISWKINLHKEFK